MSTLKHFQRQEDSNKAEGNAYGQSCQHRRFQVSRKCWAHHGPKVLRQAHVLAEQRSLLVQRARAAVQRLSKLGRALVQGRWQVVHLLVEEVHHVGGLDGGSVGQRGQESIPEYGDNIVVQDPAENDDCLSELMLLCQCSTAVSDFKLLLKSPISVDEKGNPAQQSLRGVMGKQQMRTCAQLGHSGS